MKLVYVSGLFLVLYFARTLIFLDPDFGWHLKTGEHLLTFGFPVGDPFSYTMPSYQFIAHTWLGDVILAVLYHRTGWIGLAVFFSLITFISLIVSIKTVPASPQIRLPFFILALGIFFGFVVIRPLVFGWLFFSLLIFLISDNSRWEKYRLALLPLMLTWFNFHPSFFGGFLTLAVFLVCRWWQRKRVVISDLVVYSSALLLTIAQPYGWELWSNIKENISSPVLKKEIQEWQYWQNVNVPLVFLAGLATFLVVYFRRRFPLEKSAVLLFWIIMAFYAVRNLPLLTLAAIPVGIFGLEKLKETLATNPVRQARFTRVLTGANLLFAAVVLIHIPFYFLGTYGLAEDTAYPSGAVTFLRTYPSTGNLFSQYAWGGYLLWKLPEKKTFVDGRMPHWRQSGLAGESPAAFPEFLEITRGQVPTLERLDYWKVDTVLVAPEPKEKERTFIQQKVWQFLNRLDQPEEEPPFGKFTKQLEDGEWKVVYKDEIGVIYRR